MKKLSVTLLLSTLIACSGGDKDSTGRDGESRGQAAESSADSSGHDPCEILKAAWSADLLGTDASAVTFKPSSTIHPLCMVSWEVPNAEELKAEMRQRISDHMRRRVQAQSKGEPFDEPMPIMRTSNEVSLTIPKSTFADDAEAVARLESIVETMTKGITVEVQGRKVTSSSNYDWVEGVGARAAWSSKMSQLSVAAKSTLFHLSVRIADDQVENRRLAVDFAARVIDQL